MQDLDIRALRTLLLRMEMASYRDLGLASLMLVFLCFSTGLSRIFAEEAWRFWIRSRSSCSILRYPFSESLSCQTAPRYCRLPSISLRNLGGKALEVARCLR